MAIHEVLHRKLYSIGRADLITLLRTLDDTIPEDAKVTAWSDDNPDTDTIGDKVYIRVFHESYDAIEPGAAEEETEL